MALNRVVLLATEQDLSAAVEELTAKCRVMRAVLKRTGTPPLRDYPAGFKGLAKIVTGQQLSAASAGAIWKRFEAGLRPFDAKRLLNSSDAELKSFGLSAGKIKTLRAVADAIVARDLDFAKLNRLDDHAIRERLTALHGVGPWTADIYLLFALRRADAFPPGDLALQLAAQRLFKLSDRPNPAALEKLAERWRPWRGVAARLLWAEYAHAKREKPRVSAKTRRLEA